MKRSAWVFLTLGLATCSKQTAIAPDPCEPGSFADGPCRDAVTNHGYYSHGTFIPHVYPFLYPYYFGRYGSYTTNGGRGSPAPISTYATPTGTITRGGFGSTGSGGEGAGS